ncbi:MAG: hypothetical protein ACR2H3_07515, partial [Acidimicrobiales bacterium]
GAGWSADAAEGLLRLASVSTAPTFSPSPIDFEVAATSMADGSRVAAEVRAQMSKADRLRTALDPRPLIAAWQENRTPLAPRPVQTLRSSAS